MTHTILINAKHLGAVSSENRSKLLARLMSAVSLAMSGRAEAGFRDYNITRTKYYEERFHREILDWLEQRGFTVSPEGDVWW